MVVLGQSIYLTLPILQLGSVLPMDTSIQAAYPQEHEYDAEYEQTIDLTEFRQKRTNCIQQDSTLQCCGAADNLGQILRDGCLPGLVVLEVQLIDETVGVIRRRLYRHHPRRLLRGDVLHHSLIHQRFDVAGEEPVDHLPRVRLVEVIPVVLNLCCLERRLPRELLDYRALGHGFAGLAVDEKQPI